jgi:hypothetical protein
MGSPSCPENKVSPSSPSLGLALIILGNLPPHKPTAIYLDNPPLRFILHLLGAFWL